MVNSIPIVSSLKKKDKNNDTDTKISMVKNGEICEFYLQQKNVTPRELSSIKYPAMKFKDVASKAKRKEELFAKLTAVDVDDYFDYFTESNAKSAERLLSGLLTGRNEKDTRESKYDVGSYIYDSRETIEAHGYEIELTESPTFSVLDVVGSVVVVGDGAYETARKKREVYENNVGRLAVLAENVSQTVNSFAERDDAKCQTAVPPTRAAGVQVYGFEIADAAASTQRTAGVGGARDGRATDFDRTSMLVERILAQNTLNNDAAAAAVATAAETQPRLVHLFTVTLPGDANRGLAVRCVQWNPRDDRLLAVGYGQPPNRDYTDTLNAVAVWSTKNPYTPERFYEFDGLIITCLKFSAQHPNRMAIGFQCGEIILIDMTSKSLNILYKISKQFPLETNGILDLFWSVWIEDEFPITRRHECLVACSLNGRVARYHYAANDAFAEKVVMQLEHVDGDGDCQPVEAVAAATSKEPGVVFRAARLAELHPSTAYLVGTADGLVCSCLYDDSVACRAKINAHFGTIKSLDRSPFSPDVFLTAGCDCSIKIWVGDIFPAPVITLRTEKQVERAVWSRTDPTIIVSVIGDRIVAWDVYASIDKRSADKPAWAQPAAVSTDDGYGCTAMEFTPDGQRLCVSDVRGDVAVYDWRPAATTDDHEAECPAADRLMYCIAKKLYYHQSESKTLRELRPEYEDVFTRLHDEIEEAYFS